MNLQPQIELLYQKDTSLAFQNLKDLEALSQESSALYPFIQTFSSMLSNEKYVVRVRGFRLLCKQARWDDAGFIDANITAVLHALDDEKPTAVRQKLTALEDVARYKPQLHSQIRSAALSIDLTRLKDTMSPLIIKDVQRLLNLMETAEA